MFRKLKYSLLSLLILGSVVTELISSCSQTSTSLYTISATVSGSKYSSPYCIAVQQSNYIAIEGLASSVTPTYPYISIYLLNYTNSTGTFGFDSTKLSNYATYSLSASEVKIAKSGSVTITSVSPNIVGTFNFVCADGTTVSNGAFTCKSF